MTSQKLPRKPCTLNPALQTFPKGNAFMDSPVYTEAAEEVPEDEGGEDAPSAFDDFGGSVWSQLAPDEWEDFHRAGFMALARWVGAVAPILTARIDWERECAALEFKMKVTAASDTPKGGEGSEAAESFVAESVQSDHLNVLRQSLPLGECGWASLAQSLLGEVMLDASSLLAAVGSLRRLTAEYIGVHREEFVDDILHALSLREGDIESRPIDPFTFYLTEVKLGGFLDEVGLRAFAELARFVVYIHNEDGDVNSVVPKGALHGCAHLRHAHNPAGGHFELVLDDKGSPWSEVLGGGSRVPRAARWTGRGGADAGGSGTADDEVNEDVLRRIHNDEVAMVFTQGAHAEEERRLSPRERKWVDKFKTKLALYGNAAVMLVAAHLFNVSIQLHSIYAADPIVLNPGMVHTINLVHRDLHHGASEHYMALVPKGSGKNLSTVSGFREHRDRTGNNDNFEDWLNNFKENYDVQDTIPDGNCLISGLLLGFVSEGVLGTAKYAQDPVGLRTVLATYLLEMDGLILRGLTYLRDYEDSEFYTPSASSLFARSKGDCLCSFSLYCAEGGTHFFPFFVLSLRGDGLACWGGRGSRMKGSRVRGAACTCSVSARPDAGDAGEQHPASGCAEAMVPAGCDGS